MARILIIDDDEVICRGIKSILEQSGYEVDVSLSGENGVRKAEAADYDLVYLDIHMPGISALETFRSIKKIRKDIRVCIITAMPDEKITEYLLLVKEKEIDKIVHKPVFKDMLLKTTGELLEGASEGRKILVVDDDQLIRESFKSVLGQFDYDIDFVKSAKEAANSFKPGKYQLIFLDLALPDRDGRELLADLRSKDKEVKICVMSGYLSRLGNLLERRGNEATNTVFCMKPITRKEIIKITKTTISEK